MDSHQHRIVIWCADDAGRARLCQVLAPLALDLIFESQFDRILDHAPFYVWFYLPPLAAPAFRTTCEQLYGHVRCSVVIPRAVVPRRLGGSLGFGALLDTYCEAECSDEELATSMQRTIAREWERRQRMRSDPV